MKRVALPTGFSLFIPQLIRVCAYLAIYFGLAVFSTNLKLTAWGSVSALLPTGLTFGIFLIEGLSFAPILFGASLLSAVWLFQSPLELPLVLQTFLTTAIYAFTAFLLKHKIKLDTQLRSTLQIENFILVTVVALIAVGFVNTLFHTTYKQFQPEQFFYLVLLGALNEALSIFTITPFLLTYHGVLVQAERKLFQRKPTISEPLFDSSSPLLIFLQIFVGLLVIWLVFALSGSSVPQLFYLCFIPLVGIAVTGGVRAVALGLLVINTAMLLFIGWADLGPSNLLPFIPFFSATSLFLGAAITERKLTEISLRFSENSLRSIFENLYDAIVLHDLDGSIIDVNQRLLNYLHLSRKQVKPLPPFSIYCAGSLRDEVFKAHWQEACEGKPQLFEWNLCVPGSDDHMEAEIYLTPLVIGGDDVILAALRDISPRKQAEKVQNALAVIAESASTAANLQALFETFHQAIHQVMPADNFYICLVDRENQTLWFPYFVDQYDSTPPRVSLKDGLTEYVLRTSRPLLATPDVFANLVECGEVKAVGAASIDWLGVPLKVQDQTIGVMAVQSYSENVRFSQTDLAFLSLVAPHVAMAIEHKSAVETLQQQHDFIRTIYDSSPDAILSIGLDEIITDCNPATVSLLEMNSRTDVVGKPAFYFVADSDQDETRVQLAETLRNGIAKHIEFHLVTKSGVDTVVELSASLIQDENGQPSFYVAHLVDITQRKRTEDALRISEERYSLAMLGANDGLWDWDLTSNQIYYSSRWKAMMGLAEAISDQPEEWLKRVHPDDLPRLKSDIESHLAGLNPQLESEYRVLHQSGVYRWMQVRGMAVHHPGEKPHRLAGSQTDITERKTSEQRLIHEALHDSLTSLPNRVLFIDRLEQAIKRKLRHPEDSFAVLFIDFDRFKVINDSMGHLAGDQVLINIARRLETCLRLEDTVARLSGDEFAILLTDLENVNDVHQIAARIEKEVSRPSKINGQQVITTVSIGIALSDSSYEKAEELLRDADTAMYQAKAQGGNRHAIFDMHMHTQAVELLRLEMDLRQALESNQFRVYYQPIFSLHSYQIIGAEALLRWMHPADGLRMPSEFIELAEETGLMVPIGEWLLKTVCQQLKVWQMMGTDQFKIAINLSARQFQHENLPKMIRTTLVEYGLLPIDIELEITEGIEFINTQFVEDIVNELSSMGVGISIDDFGTGYSSLNTLKRLTITNIKIAQSFVSAIGQQNENDLILDSIIQMSHNLGYQVIAEGVEEPEQLRFLKSIDCDLIQGYLIGKPMPAEEFERTFFGTGEPLRWVCPLPRNPFLEGSFPATQEIKPDPASPAD